MNEAMLYETIRSLASMDDDRAWQAYCAISSQCDVSAPFAHIVLDVARILSIQPHVLNDAHAVIRHSFEAYPFDYAVIKEGDERFPSSADGIHFLYAYGDMTLLDQEPVTVLGMRGPSDEARSAAVSVLRELMDMGRPVMSTLDTGLDAYSMLYALNQRMKQIVVLASPLHQCMPECQKDLMEGIANSGSSVLITPFPPSSRAQKWFTVPRNGLLVAMTDFLVILEERDGGPLWKLASGVMDAGGRVMVTDTCLANPANTYAARFSRERGVLAYRRRGDLRRHLQTSSPSTRRHAGDDGQLELF